jgi:hypothetical protein
MWLNDWSWGLLPTPSLQRYASGAIRSGFDNGLMRRLASLGTSGVHHKNMNAQIMSWIRKVIGMC